MHVLARGLYGWAYLTDRDLMRSLFWSIGLQPNSLSDLGTHGNSTNQFKSASPLFFSHFLSGISKDLHAFDGATNVDTFHLNRENFLDINLIHLVQHKIENGVVLNKVGV